MTTAETFFQKFVMAPYGPGAQAAVRVGLNPAKAAVFAGHAADGADGRIGDDFTIIPPVGRPGGISRGQP